MHFFIPASNMLASFAEADSGDIMYRMAQDRVVSISQPIKVEKLDEALPHRQIEGGQLFEGFGGIQSNI